MLDFKHGDILPESFRDLFPEDVYDLIIQISRQGFGLTLVGGAVRDYLVNESLSYDLDFELRHSFEYKEEEWKKMIVRLGETLKNKHSHYVEILPFEILKIKLGSYEIELSSPREETYVGEPPYGHSEFDVHLSPNISYERSFQRRDFTLNALGIEFGVPGSDDEFKFIDPFSGIEDLKKGELRPCGKNYYHDPVRFLRLIRFSEKFGFNFVGDIKQFDLTELTAHYFFQECLKNFFPMGRLFFKAIEQEGIPLAIDLKDLSFLKDIDVEEMGFLSKSEVLMCLTFLDKTPNVSDLQNLVRLGGMKSSSVEDFASLKRNLESLSHINENKIKQMLRHSNFVELLENEDMVNMRTLHQIYNRHRFGSLDVMKEINPEVYETFTFFKRLFGEETLGKTVAGKLMRMIKEKEKYSIITIYCHLLVKFDLRPILPESKFGN